MHISKRIAWILAAILLLFCFSGCSSQNINNEASDASLSASVTSESETPSSADSDASSPEDSKSESQNSESLDTDRNDSSANTQKTESQEPEVSSDTNKKPQNTETQAPTTSTNETKQPQKTESTSESTGEETTMNENNFYIKANGTTFTAAFADNSSADALRELLRKGDISVATHDYGNFEKVGSLGSTLPRNDTQITTAAGDVILYQGNQITVYYGTNSWSFTRLGKIENTTKTELLEAFGDSDVTITFSLNK